MPESLTMYLVRDRQSGDYLRRRYDTWRARQCPSVRYGPLVSAKVYGQKGHAGLAIKVHDLDADVVEAKLSVIGQRSRPARKTSAQDAPFDCEPMDDVTNKADHIAAFERLFPDSPNRTDDED